jgi:hypothetical protein
MDLPERASEGSSEDVPHRHPKRVPVIKETER